MKTAHRTIPVLAALALSLVLAPPLVAKGKKPEEKKPPVTRVVDLHCDTVYQGVDKGWDLDKNKGAVDLGKMRKGNYLGQVFALWTPTQGKWKYLEKLNKKFDGWMTEYEDDIALVRDPSDLARVEEEGKLAGFLGVEGLRPLDGDVEKIRVLHAWGVRVLGLTWWHSNAFAGSSTDPQVEERTGLTEAGREAVRLANELGMIIDVSHASDQTVRDVAGISEDPFIASHSCAKALRDHERNLDDDLLRLIVSKGGVVGVNFYVDYLSDDPPKTVKRAVVVEHVLHMVEVMGAEHVALGSDFDGAKTPMGLKHGGHMQKLARDLLDAGLSQEQVDGIMYANALRVFLAVTAPDPAPALQSRLAAPLP